MPLVADDADETVDPSTPWTIHVASAMVQVSSVLLNELLSKRFFQMLIEWCDTPCQILGLTCIVSCSLGLFSFLLNALSARDACWKFVHSTLVPCSPSPSNNILVLVDFPLTCPRQDALSRDSTSFWTPSIAGGVGQSLVSHVIDCTFRDHHRWVDMNVYFDDHEMRIVTGQESPDRPSCARRLFQEAYQLGSCCMPPSLCSFDTGWKRYEMNELLRFSGTTEESSMSIFASFFGYCAQGKVHFCGGL